jgi:hypothetical protein
MVTADATDPNGTSQIGRILMENRCVYILMAKRGFPRGRAALVVVGVIILKMREVAVTLSTVAV